MIEKQTNIHSKFLTIQQVASMIKITPRQLRYWERYGVIKPKMVERGKRSDRRYSLKDLAVLKKALFLRKKKMSIKRLSNIIKNPALHFDIKAFDIEQKFNKERTKLIKEALVIYKQNIKNRITLLEQNKQEALHDNNEYIQLVSNLEQIDQILIELE